MQRINYQLFRQRKNFDPTILFKNNLTLSYEEFSSFFVERNVEPPSEKYYMNVKTHCESLSEATQDAPEDEKVVTDVVPVLDTNLSEDFVLEPEEVKETVELVKEVLEGIEEKPKKRRRRKKKVESDE